MQEPKDHREPHQIIPELSIFTPLGGVQASEVVGVGVVGCRAAPLAPGVDAPLVYGTCHEAWRGRRKVGVACWRVVVCGVW